MRYLKSAIAHVGAVGAVGGAMLLGLLLIAASSIGRAVQDLYEYFRGSQFRADATQLRLEYNSLRAKIEEILG